MTCVLGCDLGIQSGSSKRIFTENMRNFTMVKLIGILSLIYGREWKIQKAETDWETSSRNKHRHIRKLQQQWFLRLGFLLTPSAR